MVCLQGTDPATIFLSAFARVDGLTIEDCERAFYADRSLVKHLAMRRTLFVFPRERLAALKGVKLPSEGDQGPRRPHGSV